MITQIASLHALYGPARYPLRKIFLRLPSGDQSLVVEEFPAKKKTYLVGS